jgi:hypothetical protein
MEDDARPLLAAEQPDRRRHVEVHAAMADRAAARLALRLVMIAGAGSACLQLEVNRS